MKITLTKFLRRSDLRVESLLNPDLVREVLSVCCLRKTSQYGLSVCEGTQIKKHSAFGAIGLMHQVEDCVCASIYPKWIQENHKSLEEAKHQAIGR